MTDIYLITGFLGAGKTTLMKNLLAQFKNCKTAIIVNEFGREGVDGALLEKEGMVIEEIVNGSIFCVCRSDKFIDAVIKTRTLDIDYLIIEASGLADPFGMDEVMGIVNKIAPDSFHYSGSICVVDAKNYQRVCQLAPAAKHQVQGADLLIINKIDTVTKNEITILEHALRDINSHAEIISGSYGKLPEQEKLLSLEWHNFDRKNMIVKKTLGVSKLMYEFDDVPVEKLAEWLKTWSEKVYRIKGFCSKYCIQAVQNDVSFSEFPREKDENFFVVLGTINDDLKNDIISSWKEFFHDSNLRLHK